MPEVADTPSESVTVTVAVVDVVAFEAMVPEMTPLELTTRPAGALASV